MDWKRGGQVSQTQAITVVGDQDVDAVRNAAAAAADDDDDQRCRGFFLGGPLLFNPLQASYPPPLKYSHGHIT